jgi:GNAT superfamily N-acetyltransferase
MVQIRPARPQDAQALTDLAVRSEAHWGHDATFMDTFRRIYAVTPAFIERNPAFLAEDARGLAGFYALVPEEGGLSLEYLFLEPDRLGEGLGRTLWQHMAAHCRAQGIREVRLVCGPEPKAFYLKMGAVETGEIESLVRPGRKVACMAFAIEPLP